MFLCKKLSILFVRVGLIFIGALLSGCIGGYLVHPNTLSENKPFFSADGDLMPNESGIPMTCSAARAIFGKADNVNTSGRLTTYTYHHGFVWAGVEPVILIPIPIPLIAPVGKQKTALVCDGEVIVSATAAVTAHSGFICGIMLSEVNMDHCRSGPQPEFAH